MPRAWQTRAAAGVVVVAAGLTLWQLPGDARRLHADIANGRAQSDLRRELAPARTVQIADPPAFVRAAEAMPAGARYFVQLGGRVPGSNAIGLGYVPAFASYWLAPRVRVGSIADATWVLSYGGRLSALPVRFARVVRVGPGVAVAEIRR